MIRFPCKYRKRIEIRILKLKLELSEVQREKKEYERLHLLPKICRCWVREKEIESDINLLKEMLIGESVTKNISE